MSFKTFLKLVEIQTKIASVFPFVLGTLFAVSYFKAFSLVNTIIFFVAMLLFDMTTTAINNYMDYKKATDSHDYRDQVNIIGQEQIKESLVITVILSMLAGATVLGLVLVYRTSVVLLFIGMLCFLIGIFYTFGPVPLSRMPLGEVFSGITMGLGIFFISVFIQEYPNQLLNFLYQDGIFLITGNLWNLLAVFLVSVPGICTIANLMLANNICDLDEDVLNNRYTLPYYIGKKNAVLLFNVLYMISFAAIVLGVLLKVLHPVVLLSLIAIYPVKKNVSLFNRKQVKSETFAVSVKNLILINGAEVLALALAMTITAISAS